MRLVPAPRLGHLLIIGPGEGRLEIVELLRHHRHDLIHIVLAAGHQAADEADVHLLRGQCRDHLDPYRGAG
ncbi:MAG: hypothetical protein K1X78_12320 [Verrucomicrobiaceae bacterium]|nr:hypothetical protein [Verrucomicrobiaceae bacterium]